MLRVLSLKVTVLEHFYIPQGTGKVLSKGHSSVRTEFMRPIWKYSQVYKEKIPALILVIFSWLFTINGIV